MKNLRELISKNLSGKKVLAMFIIANLFYVAMLTITIPKTTAFSNGMKLLDMMPTGYTPDYILKLFDTLGEEGRKSYLFYQIPLDLIYPFFFGISNCLILAYFLKKLNKLNSPFFYLTLIPLVAGFFDYLENFGIITMLVSYPNLSPFMMKATNIFTITKSFTTTVYFFVLIITLIAFGIQYLKNRMRKQNA